MMQPKTGWVPVVLMLALAVPAAAADDPKAPDKKPDPKAAKAAPEKKPAAKDAAKPDAKDLDKADKKPDPKAAKPEDKDKPAAKPELPPARPAYGSKPDPKEKDKDKVVFGLVFAGKITSLENSQKTFTVQIDTPLVIPYRLGNTFGVQVQHLYRDIDLEAAEDLKVRLAAPPMEYDEKGKPKKYTAKELRELKGPGNLWGFPGDFDNLKLNQVVRVYLAKSKTPPKPMPRLKKADKDQLPPAEEKSKAVMVHILADVKR